MRKLWEKRNQYVPIHQLLEKQAEDLSSDDLYTVMEIPNRFHVEMRVREHERQSKIWLCVKHNNNSDDDVIPIVTVYSWPFKMVLRMIVEYNCGGYGDNDIVEDLHGDTLIHQLARHGEHESLLKFLSKRQHINVLFYPNKSGHTPLEVTISNEIRFILLSNILRHNQTESKGVGNQVKKIVDSLWSVWSWVMVFVVLFQAEILFFMFMNRV